MLHEVGGRVLQQGCSASGAGALQEYLAASYPVTPRAASTYATDRIGSRYRSQPASHHSQCALVLACSLPHGGTWRQARRSLNDGVKRPPGAGRMKSARAPEGARGRTRRKMDACLTLQRGGVGDGATGGRGECYRDGPAFEPSVRALRRVEGDLPGAPKRARQILSWNNRRNRRSRATGAATPASPVPHCLWASDLRETPMISRCQGGGVPLGARSCASDPWRARQHASARHRRFELKHQRASARRRPVPSA